MAVYDVENETVQVKQFDKTETKLFLKDFPLDDIQRSLTNGNFQQIFFAQ